MLEVNDYIKINKFKDTIQQLPFIETEFPGFRQNVSTAMENIFGFKYTLFGLIQGRQKKELSLDVVMHNVDLPTTQRLLGSSVIMNEVLSSEEDVFVLSQRPNYKKSVTYLDVMKVQGFSDFVLFFLTVKDAYIGYVIIIKDEKQKKFTPEEIETIRLFKSYLGVEYYRAC